MRKNSFASPGQFPFPASVSFQLHKHVLISLSQVQEETVIAPHTAASGWVWMQPCASPLGHLFGFSRASGRRLGSFTHFSISAWGCVRGWGNKGDPLRGMLEMSGGDGLGKSATSLRGDPFSGSLPGCGDHKVSELLLQGLISARLVALCFFKSLVIFSSSEFGSRGLLYSSSSSLSELSFIFSVSESCFFLAEAISAACLFRHLVLLFWNQTWWEEREEKKIK